MAMSDGSETVVNDIDEDEDEILRSPTLCPKEN